MEHFEGVANTTFVPLVARIYFSKRFPDVFYDEKALELEPYLPDKATKGSFEYTNIASVARYYITDRMVEDFIEAHGPSNVIYFGAGLESAYFRISKKLGQGKAFFYEIDLPEVIETRRKVFGENENEKLIGGDMFSFDWASGIADKGLPTIMIVSGVFQYFLEEDILKFIARLSKVFPGQEFIFDATSKKGLKFTNWFIKRTGNKDALMTFGIDDSQAFADKAHITLLEEKLFFKDLRVVLKKRANLVSRVSMWDCDLEKKCLILRLALSDKTAKD